MNDLIIYIWIGIAIITFFYLTFFKTAPYGRHSSNNWGPMIDNRLGWILMEIPALILLVIFYFKYGGTISSVSLLFVALWCVHYLNRSLIFPFRIKSNGKKMPLIIMLSAIGFNIMNTWVVGSYLGSTVATYSAEWLSDPRFIVGIALFVFGFSMNQVSDTILINLRKPGETGYKLPMHWLFRRISCPNLLGEIIEWTGFAIMTWSLPTLSFAIWTFANLAPRAFAHHKWYKEKFPNYPKERKALGLI